VQVGASPRGALAVLKLSRCRAALRGRDFVTPEDVKAVAYDVLRHRVSLTYEAEAENLTSEKVIQKILEKIEVP
jgi:MoxR-like ATPase